jgi:hypothetical protein
MLKRESEELDGLMELEKREFEEIKRRHLERADRLMERRREMLKRSGANIEDMTRKALFARPEDPRTVQLRKELDELRRSSERKTLDDARRMRELEESLRISKAELARVSQGAKDIAQLRQEAEALRERLNLREKELVSERQRNEELERNEATKNQALLARLASLESPSIGTSQTLSTNQSREAKQVKLPGWMSFKK